MVVGRPHLKTIIRFWTSDTNATCPLRTQPPKGVAAGIPPDLATLSLNFRPLQTPIDTKVFLDNQISNLE